MIEICADNTPIDYDTNVEAYCLNTCQDWANYGYCDNKWNEWKCSGSSEKIKDNCRASCNNCGNSPVHLYTILQ